MSSRTTSRFPFSGSNSGSDAPRNTCLDRVHTGRRCPVFLSKRLFACSAKRVSKISSPLANRLRADDGVSGWWPDGNGAAPFSCVSERNRTTGVGVKIKKKRHGDGNEIGRCRRTEITSAKTNRRHKGLFPLSRVRTTHSRVRLSDTPRFVVTVVPSLYPSPLISALSSPLLHLSRFHNVLHDRTQRPSHRRYGHVFDNPVWCLCICYRSLSVRICPTPQPYVVIESSTHSFTHNNEFVIAQQSRESVTDTICVWETDYVRSLWKTFFSIDLSFATGTRLPKRRL